MDWKAELKGKKVTVMGLGVLGRGVQDAAFLAKHGAEVVVTDMKSGVDLKESIEKLKGFSNITYRLGGHQLEDFRDKDFILKNAGVPLDSPYIAEARKHGVAIEMDETLFLRLAPELVTIGVTGTRGKSTTTQIIHDMCKAYFEPRGQRVFLGGNVRGIATLPLLEEVKRNDILVLELSSWQLQGFGEAKRSPHIAVFTNFMSDHMNYYKNDMEAYFADKAQIFLHQKQRDFLVAGEKVAHLITAKYHGKLFHPPETAAATGIPHDWKIGIPGEHNRENIALAIRVGKLLGIPYEAIKTAIENFRGVEGRLEYLGEKFGVKVYNDNNSTTPDATIAALKALGGEGQGNITLIMGGADKTLDMSRLVELLPKYCGKVVLLPGTGSELLVKNVELLEKTGEEVKKILKKTKALEEAVGEAFKDAKKGSTVLFSPAFASFGLFKNEYDRNDQFKAIIEKM